MKEWLKLATDATVVRRALKCAVVVGAILIGINHGDAIATRDIHALRLLKMGLTIIVPYLVSTFSSIGALRQVRASSSRGS